MYTYTSYYIYICIHHVCVSIYNIHIYIILYLYMYGYINIICIYVTYNMKGNHGNTVPGYPKIYGK